MIQEFKLKLKKQGYKIIDLYFSDLLKDKHDLHQKIYTRGLAYYFKDEFHNHKKDLSNIFIKMIDDGNKIKLNEYRELTSLQQLFIKKINIMFKNVDFIVSSSTFGEAPLKNKEEKRYFFNMDIGSSSFCKYTIY